MIPVPPHGWQEPRVGRLHLPPERVEGIMHVGADVHVRQPRRVAVRLVGRNVIDGARPLVGRERAASWRGVVGDALAVPSGVLVEGPDRIDGGELVERDLAVVDRVEPVRGAREERQVRGSKVGRRLRARCRRHPCDERVHVAGHPRLELRHPEARREEQVHELQPPGAVERAVVLRAYVRAPVLHHGVDRHADAEHASRVQACEKAQIPLAERGRRQRLLFAYEALELDLAQPSLELVEGAVLREHQASGVDERAVGAPALPEIARVLGEDIVRQQGGDPELVAATDMQMEVPRIGRPRREARVEGRLGPIVIHTVRGRIDRPLVRPERRNHSRQQQDRDPPHLPHAAPPLLQSSSSFARSSVWPAPTLRSSRLNSIPLSLSNGTRFTV